MKSFIFWIAFLLLQLLGHITIAQESPATKAYYVIDGSCCGGEESDPHAVFGIETSDGYILLGKSIDNSGNENGFAVKISKNLPQEKLFLHPEEEESFEWSLVIGAEDRRDGFNSAAIYQDHIFIAGYKETQKDVIDRFLTKVRLQDGEVIWSRSFPSKNQKSSSAFESVILTSENGILLTGVTNSDYEEIEGFKSYGNPSGGNAFSMYFSQEKITSDSVPNTPTWEKEYKNSVSGKSVKEITDTGEFVIATSTPEPMVATVLKISKNGNLLWAKKYPDHGEITDIAVTNDGFFMSGHKGEWETGIDGSITKISETGNIYWNKVYGNPVGGKQKFSGLGSGNKKIIFDECWGIAALKNEGAVMACGTGIEGCDELNGEIRNQCEEDPRTTWRSYLIRIDSVGSLIWEKASSFTFPGEEGEDDVPSTASEWAFITKNGELASVVDLAFGIGLEIIDLNR